MQEYFLEFKGWVIPVNSKIQNRSELLYVVLRFYFVLSLY